MIGYTIRRSGSVQKAKRRVITFCAERLPIRQDIINIGKFKNLGSLSVDEAMQTLLTVNVRLLR